MKEEWKQIPGLPSYHISNYGHVFSFIKMKELSPWVNNEGTNDQHIRITIGGKKYLVHRLVLITFKGPPSEGTECSHLDGNPSNNRLDNLAWETPLINTQRKEKHGTQQKGESVPTSKLKEIDVREIRKLYARGIDGKKLAERFGVTDMVIYKILNGKAWKHVK